MYSKFKYPDGSSYVKVDEFVDNFTFRIDSYEDLWTLNQIRDVYKHNGRNATVTIPNLLDAQADRRFDGNQPHGLKLVCDFINSMGWQKIKVFHPHNPEVVEALLDNVEIIDNSSFIVSILPSALTLKGYEKHNNVHDNLILMSSDAGGFKPLMKLCDKMNWRGGTSSASKSRKYINGKTELTQIVQDNDFEGKDILIIDDIMVGGGTFLGLAKILKERNCGKLYLAVSHITTGTVKEEILNTFDCIFTTNSKSVECSNNKLHVVNVF